MNDELKAFEQFIDDISGANLERDWRLVAPRLKELGDAYITSLPWHKRLRFRVSSRMRHMWIWFDFWVFIPIEAFIRVVRRGQR